MSKKQILYYITVFLLLGIIVYFSIKKQQEINKEGFMNIKAYYHSTSREIRNIFHNFTKKISNLFHKISRKF